MTGSDRIWATEDKENFGEDRFHSTFPMKGLTEYVRRDPAVLAALPEVQALIETAQWARNRLERIADDCWHGDGRDLKRSIIGIFADFDAALLACGSIMPDEIRALTPADATAALARIVREAEARGMERAADRARVYASNYEQSSDGRNTFILLAEWADAEAAAILARAAGIEKDGK